ncbi:hypothetical protein NQ318_017578 [Aromia moschata]|uniref:Uncharacterized protein n=1 Tax=Aromia moschata TaxID=1265417 RepID=A0AAV8Z1G2_9CUCU|nr:hypothetical protein NQ318_017578 [Aromia moschata]
MKSFVGVVFLLVASFYCVEGCGSKNIECITDSTFKFCFTVGDTIVYVNSIVLSCSNTTTCDETEGLYACINSTATTATSTTTESTTSSTTTESTTSSTTVSTTTVSAPDCSVTGVGNYPAAACNQYYECTSFLWWYYLNLMTCSSGEA